MTNCPYYPIFCSIRHRRALYRGTELRVTSPDK